MQIKKIDSGLLHSNMYIVEENGHAIIIDPCMDTSAAADLVVDLMILTHEHYDHISGVNAWKEDKSAPLLCSRSCAENIRNPKKNLSRYFDVFCEMQTWVPIEEMEIEPVNFSCEADKIFEDRLVFDWQGHTITLLETPGHSPGSILIDLDHSDYFTGDSLLENYETEVRFPGGSPEKWDTIGKTRIMAVPEGARIWPGHFEEFTNGPRKD